MAPLACMRVRMTSRGCTAADTRAPEMTPDSADAALLFPFLFLLPPFCCCCCADRCDSGCAAWAEAAAPMPAQLVAATVGCRRRRRRWHQRAALWSVLSNSRSPTVFVEQTHKGFGAAGRCLGLGSLRCGCGAGCTLRARARRLTARCRRAEDVGGTAGATSIPCPAGPVHDSRGAGSPAPLQRPGTDRDCCCLQAGRAGAALRRRAAGPVSALLDGDWEGRQRCWRLRGVH